MSGIIRRVEGDTLPALAVQYEGVDLTGYQAVRLHIAYRPWPLVRDAVITDPEEGAFEFEWEGQIEFQLAAPAVAGSSSLIIGEADFAALPAAGELVIDGEHVRYESKAAPDELVLTSPLENQHALGALATKLPDLRRGTWPAEISLTDAEGNVLTFRGLTFEVAEEIA